MWPVYTTCMNFLTLFLGFHQLLYYINCMVVWNRLTCLQTIFQSSHVSMEWNIILQAMKPAPLAACGGPLSLQCNKKFKWSETAKCALGSLCRVHLKAFYVKPMCRMNKHLNYTTASMQCICCMGSVNWITLGHCIYVTCIYYMHEFYNFVPRLWWVFISFYIILTAWLYETGWPASKQSFNLVMCQWNETLYCKRWNLHH